MAPQRSVSMNRMWFDWKETFPESDRASDGWLGDQAHAKGKSGHNPDDTPGVEAERTDADTKQEVRAIDKDKDLRDPHGVTLEMVIQRMLKTPADLNRLIYIIYKRRIWRKANGWKQEAYSGDNAHDEHAHFSGDPASDENGAEWQSITYFKNGNDMADFSNTDPNAWKQARRIESLHKNLADSIGDGTASSEPNGLHVKLEEIKTLAAETKDAVLALSVGGVTQAMVTEAMVAALQNPDVLAALAPVIAEQAFQGSQRAEQE